MVETQSRRPAAVVKPSLGKHIIWPGLLMLVSQLRAVLSFASPTMSTADGLAIVAALCFTGFFGVMWFNWRALKLANGATKRRTWWPVLGFAVLPLVFAGGYLYQWIDGPSAYSALKSSALTACNLPGDEWRDARGGVGVIEAPDGEIVYVYNVQREHGEAVLRPRSTRDADFAWYDTLVLDGRNPRASRMLCFEDRDAGNATLRDISTGQQVGTDSEVSELVQIANS